jgi:sec-independent protein translocase protein TatC
VVRALANLRPIGHKDQLAIVDHLDELRLRLIVSAAVLAVAFGFCFWQNHRLLSLINAPLAHQTQAQVRDGHGPLGQTYTVQRGTRDVAIQLRVITGLLRSNPAASVTLRQVRASLDRDISRLSAPPAGNHPVTLGIGEPFTTTVTVSLVFALILALPVLLWQLYAFMAPALDPESRRRTRPLAGAVPLLALGGLAFGYYVVLPAAVKFFQNFNSDEFNTLVQASQYYKFAATTLLAMAVMFQVPVVILAVTRAGLVTPRQLRAGRRYAVAACAAVAAVLPGDVVTMLLETVPLYLLYEASIVLATLVERRAGNSDLAGAEST